MAITRVSMSLVADAAGVFAPARFAPFTGVLLAVASLPGTPSLRDGFSVHVIDTLGMDVLFGAGEGRSGRFEERRVIRMFDRVDLQPFISAREELTLHVAGNDTPGACLTVSLLYST